VLVTVAAHRAGAVHEVKSLYTALDFTACANVETTAGGDARLCDGLPGYPVYVAERDLRTYLSVGAAVDRTRAAQQTLQARNTLFEAASARTTVEWRFVIRDGSPVPYATIVRYFTSNGTARGEVLVVTRVSEGEACHVAYIDALANADAIVIARHIADERARTFSCDQEPTVEGAIGKSPM
jgi:hypothetical protein